MANHGDPFSVFSEFEMTEMFKSLPAHLAQKLVCASPRVRNFHHNFPTILPDRSGVNKLVSLNDNVEKAEYIIYWGSTGRYTINITNKDIPVLKQAAENLEKNNKLHLMQLSLRYHMEYDILPEWITNNVYSIEIRKDSMTSYDGEKLEWIGKCLNLKRVKFSMETYINNNDTILSECLSIVQQNDSITKVIVENCTPNEDLHTITSFITEKKNLKYLGLIFPLVLLTEDDVDTLLRTIASNETLKRVLLRLWMLPELEIYCKRNISMVLPEKVKLDVYMARRYNHCCNYDDCDDLSQWLGLTEY